MKRNILSVLATCLVYTASQAQLVNDTVVVSPSYANNIWYSLENDDQATASATDWHIGLSTSMGPAGTLTTAVLFNSKLGNLYEIPDSDPTDFANADTAGFSTWMPLFNSDETWALGAFNNTEDLGQMDYGWGNYNMTTHGIDANRIFIVKLTAGGFYKLMLSSANTMNTYTLTFDKLDNSALVTETINVTAYDSKNFVYYNLTTETIADREPSADNWDLLFHQYPASEMGGYIVAGVFQNEHVRAAKAYPVDDTLTYVDFGAETFQDEINTIGWNWKVLNAQMTGYNVADSTVFFIEDRSGDVWKVIMTGFVGASAGKFMFAKEKISELGVNEENELFATVYPNPASDIATVIVKNAPSATIAVYNMAGTFVRAINADVAALSAIHVNTTELSNGVYQLVITSGSAVTTQKLVVQH